MFGCGGAVLILLRLAGLSPNSWPYRSINSAALVPTVSQGLTAAKPAGLLTTSPVFAISLSAFARLAAALQ